MPSAKRSHAAVNYRGSNAPGRACATCSMYIDGEPPHCTDVVDPIYPEGVCNIWAQAQHEGGQLPRMRVPSGVVDPNYTVRSGAVASARQPGLTYVDYRLDRKFWPFVAEHEQEERAAMQEGMPYITAHDRVATPAEQHLVETQGAEFNYDWDLYTRQIDGELSTIEHQKGERPTPPDPHVNIDDAVAVGHHRGKHHDAAASRKQP